MFSDDSDAEETYQLTINEHYAKAFEYRKEREELSKLQEKYGSGVDEDHEEEEDSEELESEDEDGEELTPAVDAAILRTLARIKRKDPSIYQSEKDVFEEEIKKSGKLKPTAKTQKDKSKPLTIRQQILQSQLEPNSRSQSPQPLTHAEEQEALRKETITAFHTGTEGGDGDNDEDFLVPREKTKDELEREEEAYKEYLKREVGEELEGLITLEAGDDKEDAGEARSSQPEETKKKKRKAEDKKRKEDEDHEFLMNYILGRGWIDKSAKRLPTYKEITSGKSKGKGKGKARAGYEVTERDAEDADTEEEQPVADELDEEEFDEVAERFESSYNFRFEEPGADQIVRFPRTIGSTVRREESTRKEARARRKERKEVELLQKKEEVKRLKTLKMKEIREKLERIGREGGKKLDETTALGKLDLDSDWDSEEHDKRMGEIYGDNDDGAVDEEKPQWDNDIDIADIVPPEAEGAVPSDKKKKKKKKKKGADNEDEDGVNVDEMDADVQNDVEEWDGTEEMRKRKVEEYMEEVYNLDFNDMTAGMPTRFRWTKVQPQSFALTPAEILLATDTELNQYMGLKKYAPYRKDSSNWDRNRAARFRELKAKIAARRVASFEGGGGVPAELVQQQPAKKRKGKKERMREKAAAAQDGGEADADREEGEDTQKTKEDKVTSKINQRTAETFEAEAEETDGPSKKRRRRHKKSSHSDLALA